jgi:hypothetical protein
MPSSFGKLSNFTGGRPRGLFHLRCSGVIALCGVKFL